MAGIAPEAYLVMVKHGDKLWSVDVTAMLNALKRAVEYQGAKVVGMSLQADNWFDSVADRIAAYYSNEDVVFLAATGSAGWEDNVIFPAEMSKVIAVTAVNLTNNKRYVCAHTGDEVELASYHGATTTGQYSVEGLYGRTASTSNATTVMTGIVALARSRFPNETNREIRTRFHGAAALRDLGATGWDKVYGHGLVDALYAVGGLYDVGGLVETPYPRAGVPFIIKITARGGIGPWDVSYTYNGVETWHFNTPSSRQYFTFSAAGAYNVLLKAVDRGVTAHSVTRTFPVTVGPAPTLSIIGVWSISEKGTYTFTSSLSNFYSPSYGNWQLQYCDMCSWTSAGSGASPLDVVLSPNCDTGATEVRIRLRVTDPYGADVTTVHSVSVCSSSGGDEPIA